MGDFNAGVKGNSKNTSWMTPPYIIEALGGKFDLDPCAPNEEHWTANKCFTEEIDGLKQEWFGEVFLNPPYSNPEIGLFMNRLAEHGNGIALLFARTGNKMFHESVWNKATSILFLRKRVRFIDSNGVVGGSPGADSCIVAYGEEADLRLKIANVKNGLEGKYVRLK